MSNSYAAPATVSDFKLTYATEHECLGRRQTNCHKPGDRPRNKIARKYRGVTVIKSSATELMFRTRFCLPLFQYSLVLFTRMRGRMNKREET